MAHKKAVLEQSLTGLLKQLIRPACLVRSTFQATARSAEVADSCTRLWRHSSSLKYHRYQFHVPFLAMLAEFAEHVADPPHWGNECPHKGKAKGKGKSRNGIDAHPQVVIIREMGSEPIRKATDLKKTG